MLRNVFIYLVVAIGIFLLAVSSFPRLMKKIVEARMNTKEWWAVHSDTRGNLVQMSYLDNETKFLSLPPVTYKSTYDGPAKVNLYISGDSYLEPIPADAFAGIASYHYSRHDREQLRYHLDTSQYNILIIENGEFSIRDNFKRGQILTYIYDSTIVNMRKVVVFDTLQNFKSVSKNLESLLFNNIIFNPVRQLKASLNYTTLSRVSGEVAVSTDHNYLFMKDRTDEHNERSSFAPVSAADIDSIVYTLDYANLLYKKYGFDEVYFAPIPDNASLIESGKYNQLIPLIQNDPRLKMNVINVYDQYKRDPRKICRPGDTHWTYEGMKIWLDKVNAILINANLNMLYRDNRAGASASGPVTH